MTNLAIPVFRGIISSAKVDGSQAFFLVLAAAIAKDQRNSYTVKIAPDTLAKRLPSALAAMEYLGLVLFNRIPPIKKTHRLMTGRFGRRSNVLRRYE